MEQAALRQLLARKELMVLATGGGIVSEPLTFDLILSSFYTIWLKAEPEEHMARVRSQGDLRPMADDRSAMAELRTILLSREPLYARASAVVDTAGLSVDAAAARLIDAVAPVLQHGRENVRAGVRPRSPPLLAILISHETPLPPWRARDRQTDGGKGAAPVGAGAAVRQSCVD